jgi:hypothetical protein
VCLTLEILCGRIRVLFIQYRTWNYGKYLPESAFRFQLAGRTERSVLWRQALRWQPAGSLQSPAVQDHPPRQKQLPCRLHFSALDLHNPIVRMHRGQHLCQTSPSIRSNGTEWPPCRLRPRQPRQEKPGPAQARRRSPQHALSCVQFAMSRLGRIAASPNRRPIRAALHAAATRGTEGRKCAHPRPPCMANSWSPVSRRRERTCVRFCRPPKPTSSAGDV